MLERLHNYIDRPNIWPAVAKSEHGEMEKQCRTKYPSDVSDGEWAFVAPDLTLCREIAPPSLHRAHRQPVAFHVRQSAAMGSRLSADAAVRAGRCL